MNSSQKAHDKDLPNARKPYTIPRLQIYGDLREITQTVGDMGNKDNVNTAVKTMVG